MPDKVALRRELEFPPELENDFEAYYADLFAETGLPAAAARIRKIRDLPGAVIYRLVTAAGTAGFAVVDTGNSTVKGLFLKTDAGSQGLEDAVFESLLEKHKLISIEVPEKDAPRIKALTRRGFRPARQFMAGSVSMLHMNFSIAVYLAFIKNRQPPEYKLQEAVALEQVGAGHTDAEIRAGLENLIENLGGLGRFIQPGQTAVIKPNLVSEHGLKEGVKNGGVTTDCGVIKGMIDLLQPVAGKIIIAEGSSINRSETARMFAHYGLDRLAAAYGGQVALVDLNSDACRAVAIPDGRRQATREIPRTLLEADLVINMPVLKLHFAAGASLAIKNLQGAIPPIEKYKVHFFGLWQNLINTYKIIKPGLIIIDGLFGQEGFGPISGSPRRMNLLIGGTNPVAVDSVALRVMGLDPVDSPPVLMAGHEGLGPLDPGRIDVKGVPVKAAAAEFERPLINLAGGRQFRVHDGNACPGCRGYLHFTLNKLRRPDPDNDGRLLIDRPFKKRVDLYLGPDTGQAIDPAASNVFMGACQQHNAGKGGIHLPGCPPHTEEIIGGIFSLYPEIQRPGYADKSEEAKLGDMLKTILASNH